MQHNRAGRKLGRTTAHRKALFRNQLNSLLTHERITTTLPKAKELRPLAEKLVTLGKRGGLHARRLAARTIDKDSVKRLFDEVAPRFTTRAGGYTRIMKLGQRPGDGAEMAILEFVDFDFAQRRAEKKAAEKAATDKKESLLDKARRLVTGKGKGEAAEGEKAEKAGAAAEAATEEPGERKPAKPKASKPKAEPKAGASKAAKAPKAPKPEKKGGSTRSATPRKVGGG